MLMLSLLRIRNGLLEDVGFDGSLGRGGCAPGRRDSFLHNALYDPLDHRGIHFEMGIDMDDFCGSLSTGTPSTYKAGIIRTGKDSQGWDS